MATPEKQPPKGPKKSSFSFMKWLFDFTASDPNFIPVQKQRRKKRAIPLTLQQKIKRVAIFFFVLIVFYLLLCTYILLNPSDAQFFNNVFKLEYVTIQFILEYTIYVFFGTIAIILLGLFLFFFYRGLTIKTKETLRKWIVRVIAVFFGFIFFGNLATFASVYNHFQSINFENLEGRIILYDNSVFKYLDDENKEAARLDNSTSMIGPVVIRFDLSGYIRRAEFREGLSLTQPYRFDVDYEGDEEMDYPSGEVDLALPVWHEQAPRIVMRVDEPGEYQPVGQIQGFDVAGDEITLDIPFPRITVESIIEFEAFEQPAGGVKYGFDGSELRDIGVLHWRITTDDESGHQGYKYFPDTIFTDVDVICMQVFQGDSPIPGVCDWRYVTEDAFDLNIFANMETREDPIDRFKYQFAIEDLSFNDGTLRQITWYINDLKYVGGYDSGTPLILDYRFKEGGNHIVTAKIEDTTGRVREFESSVLIGKFVELKEGFTVQLFDEEGTDLTDGTYDERTDTYIIEDVPVPHDLELDATNIRADSTRLKLTKVRWDLDNDGVFEVEDNNVIYTLPTPGRYDLRAEYTFEDITISGETEELTRVERISIIGVEKDLDVRVKMTRDGEYAPAKVKFDASGSKTQRGEIAKFLYDFGDGNIHEGEGVISYLYENPGEYKVTVTAIKADGDRGSRTYTVIIKKPQEVARINTSIASGRITAGRPLTLDALASLGEVSSVTWNLGDGSSARFGNQIVHTYKKPGTYTVTLSVKYASGVIEEAEKELVVIEE